VTLLPCWRILQSGREEDLHGVAFVLFPFFSAAVAVVVVVVAAAAIKAH